MMRAGGALCALAVAGVTALAACGTAPAATRSSAPTATGSRAPAAWHPAPSARITCTSAVQPNDSDAAILDVVATGPADAWAVGVCGADGGTHDFVGQTPTGFVEHWDGRQWSSAAVPASGEYDVVQAISPRDVWVTSVAGDPWVAATAGSAAMPGGASVIHWNGRAWTVAQQGMASSALVYALAASAGSAWALTYNHGATTVLQWSGGSWRPVAGPTGFRFATSPQPPNADPVGGGFLAGSGAGIWIGGETDASTPVTARRVASGWTTVPVPVTGTYGWIEAMAASGPNVWVLVEESGSAGGSPSHTILERFDGRSWTTLSASPLPSPVNWSVAEINVGQNYGGYLLCGFPLSAAQRAAFYGFAWTCPAGLAVTALAPVPGEHALWAAGADNPGLAMRPATAMFS
jgi:hypothetical protein